MEKSLKLVKLLQLSEKEREDQDTSFLVKQSELQLQSDILATEKSLAEEKQKRNQTIVNMPFNAERVIACDIKIEALEDGLKRLNALKVELF